MCTYLGFTLQIFNEINSRDMERINVLRGIFNDWIFVVVVASTLVFQVIIVQFLGTFASTVPLSWQLWLRSVLIGLISMIIAIFLKCIPIESNKHNHVQQKGYEALPGGPESV